MAYKQITVTVYWLNTFKRFIFNGTVLNYTMNLIINEWTHVLCAIHCEACTVNALLNKK